MGFFKRKHKSFHILEAKAAKSKEKLAVFEAELESINEKDSSPPLIPYLVVVMISIAIYKGAQLFIPVKRVYLLLLLPFTGLYYKLPIYIHNRRIHKLQDKIYSERMNMKKIIALLKDDGFEEKLQMIEELEQTATPIRTRSQPVAREECADAADEVKVKKNGMIKNMLDRVVDSAVDFENAHPIFTTDESDEEISHETSKQEVEPKQEVESKQEEEAHQEAVKEAVKDEEAVKEAVKDEEAEESTELLRLFLKSVIASKEALTVDLARDILHGIENLEAENDG
ncbi:hypothetical protein PCE1_003794 [Barthelona sp. PCE]